MEVDKIIFPGLTNGTRIYSPVTLSKQWSTLGRLAAMVIASCFGAIMSGYFVTSFVVNKQLRRAENIYLCCLGFADMIITSVVIPIATVVLLSGVWDIYPVCQSLQALAAASTYAYSILFTMVACENYARACLLTHVSETNMIRAMKVSAFMVFPFSIGLAIYGTFWRLDYDYCGRRFYGDPLFRLGTFILLHGTCCIFTLSSLISCLIEIGREKRLPHIYQRIQTEYPTLPNLVRVNFFAYTLYLAAWTPYLIVVNLFPNMADGIYYQCAWLGIGRSLITSLLYGTFCPIFSKTYSKIFLYCWYKTNLDLDGTKTIVVYAHRGGPRAAVRTHIMQQAVNKAKRAAANEAVEL